ncbi:MAG: secretin N-terminal domain-containing protein [Candidatus Omnitrophota bacterium]
MVNNPVKKIAFVTLLIFWFISGVYAAEFSKGLVYPEYSKVISMDFQNASLRDVLKIFSQQSGLNFIASEAVQDRKVTVYLDQVPVEQALDRLLTANNLEYEIEPESNVFIVSETGEPKIRTITKVFFLKYASVANSRLNSEVGAGLAYESSSDKSGTLGASTSTTSTATSSIIEIVKSILTSNGTVREDRRTNSLIVTDVPSQFPIIEQTIIQLDIPTAQVMIEVEMLDVSKNNVDKIGVKIGETLASWTGPKHTSYFPFQNDRATKTGATHPSYTLGTLDLSTASAVLQFLTTKTDTKYLARPRLLTLSNETAEIKIITQEAIGLTTSIQSSQSAATQTSQAERAETGVSLRVTPQVNPDTGEITMYIEPRVSQAKTGATFGSTTFRDPEERYTKSVLRVKDGETIVVGGLLRTDYNQTITKVPLLGDIPLLGAAFRHRDQSKDDERELLVFITPRLVRDSVMGKPGFQPQIVLNREQERPANREQEIDRALEAVEKRRK